LRSDCIFSENFLMCCC